MLMQSTFCLLMLNIVGLLRAYLDCVWELKSTLITLKVVPNKKLDLFW
jgi:hypothetical protein